MQRKAIPYGKQQIEPSDIEAVVEVLKSDYLTQGPKVGEFEKAFAEYVGSDYAVAVANGTAALHLCAMALNVKPGDKVITTPITFAASANCVSYCGGEIIFADIDPETYLLDIENVRKLLEEDVKREIKGIIPVDFAGRSVNMESFRKLADEYNCWIIEDSCHAPGAYFKNKKGEHIKAGSGKYADLAIFSFHPVKHIAAGEGGMITTDDEVLYNQLLELRTHGITKDASKFQNPVEVAIGPSLDTTESDQKAYPLWYMEMQSLGYNYRISDINCALGLSQLNRAAAGLSKRHYIALKYHKAFKGIPQIKDKNIDPDTGENDYMAHGFHLYVVEVENRAGLYNYLREHGIYCQIHYFPCHLMPFYKERGWKTGDLEHSEKYYSNCISLPMFPTLSSDEQSFVIDSIKRFYSND